VACVQDPVVREKFLKEVAAAQLPAGTDSQAPVVLESDLSGLPEPVQRYLRFMGVVGRPRDWSLRARWTGGFRLSPKQSFMPCEAWTYNTRLEVARIFHMRLRFLGFLPMRVRDTYVRGRGRMQGRLFDLISVVDNSSPEIAIGELTTYLNDAILLAPSMVLGAQTQWSAVDGSSFDVALSDRGRTVTARVLINARGAPINFSTTDRFCSDPNDAKGAMIRARWTTPVAGWQVVNGRQLPTRATAEWDLPAGPFCYADFRLDAGDIAFNVCPGA
jgi:hypothetical protein